MSASASLYKCEDCKAVGIKRDSVSRPRVPTGEIDAAGKPIKVKRAFCQPHLDAYRGVPTGLDRDAAEAVAYDMLGADEAHLWTLADRSASTRRHLSPLDRERVADAIRDRFVVLVVRDLQPDGSLRDEDGRTYTPIELLRVATRSNVNLSRDLRGEALDQDEALQAAGLGQTTSVAISWDPEVLALLDPADQIVLLAFADDDEADAREPNRNEASAYIAGRMIDARTVTDRVRDAATRYAAIKSQLASY